MSTTMIAEALVPIFLVMFLGYFVEARANADIAKADVGVAEANLAFAAAQVDLAALLNCGRTQRDNTTGKS